MTEPNASIEQRVMDWLGESRWYHERSTNEGNDLIRDLYAELKAQQERADAMQAQCQQALKDADIKCWLIEYVPLDKETNLRPRWWNGTSFNGLESGAWTYDAANALKFFSWAEAFVISNALLRQTHAERMPIIGIHEIRRRYGSWQPTEHIFMQPAITRVES